MKNNKRKELIIAQLPLLNTSEIAKIFGCSRQYVNELRNKTGIKNPIKLYEIQKKVFPLLGTMSDSQLAQKFEISKWTIRNWRKKANIPVYSKYRLDYQWVEKDIALIGTMPDSELAKKLNVGLPIVRNKRIELNIPTWKSRKKYSKKIKKTENPQKEIWKQKVIKDIFIYFSEDYKWDGFYWCIGKKKEIFKGRPYFVALFDKEKNYWFNSCYDLDYNTALNYIRREKCY